MSRLNSEIAVLSTFIVSAAFLLGWRAVDEARASKVVLVRSEWICRRSHPEIEVVPTPTAAEGTEHALVPVMVCDDWSRR